MEGITQLGLQKECLALTLAVLVCVMTPLLTVWRYLGALGASSKVLFSNRLPF